MLQKEIYNNIFNKKANVIYESNNKNFDRFYELAHDAVMLMNMQRMVGGFSIPNQSLFKMIKKEYEDVMKKLINEFKLIEDTDKERVLDELGVIVKQGTEDSEARIDNVRHTYDYLIEKIW